MTERNTMDDTRSSHTLLWYKEYCVYIAHKDCFNDVPEMHGDWFIVARKYYGKNLLPQKLVLKASETKIEAEQYLKQIYSLSVMDGLWNIAKRDNLYLY